MHLLVRRVTWFTIFFVPVVPIRIAHGMARQACGTWTGIGWRTMRRALRERRLTMDRPRPGFAAGPGRADPVTGRSQDPAAFFDPVEVNTNRDRWDLFLKAWPALAVAVVLAGTIGGAIVRERASGRVDDLAVGDCFVEPAGASSVKDVQHLPCVGAHDAEVFALVRMDGTTYPTTDGFDAFFNDACLGSVFEGYTGQSFDNARELDAGYFFPTSEGWQRGDRTLTCFLGSATPGGRLDHSWRGPAPGATPTRRLQTPSHDPAQPSGPVDG
jgi:hypothetical protein